MSAHYDHSSIQYNPADTSSSSSSSLSSSKRSIGDAIGAGYATQPEGSFSSSAGSGGSGSYVTAHAATGQTNNAKRLRTDDVYDDGVRSYTTRILVNKHDFSRIIGKGGSMIAQLKKDCNANIKGENVDEEQRLLVINGSPMQVMVAFERIADILYSSNNFDYSQIFRLTFLIDNSKIGKLIGAKGATLSQIKAKSGCPNLSLMKDPIEICGSSFRFITVENLQTVIRNVHNCILEVMCDPSALAHPVYGHSGSGRHSIAVPQPFIGSLAGERPIMLNDIIPMQNLVRHPYELQSETVRQLIDMQAYLKENFKLNLCISAESSSFSSLSQILPLQQPFLASSIKADNSLSMQPGEISFMVPSHVCGGIIGNKGNTLKELSEEFPVRVSVEKNEVDGKRKVRIIPTNPDDISACRNVQNCKAKIVNLVHLQYGDIII